MTLFASEIAARSLGLSPKGNPHSGQSCSCTLCGRRIQEGDLANLFKPSDSFADYPKTGSSGVVCGYCKATTPQPVMRNFQRSLITLKGVYDLNKDSARAWFWLTPPEPPYVVVINCNTSGAFHYFWRTPVTLDNRLIQLNLDGEIVQVRRERVLRAVELTRELSDALLSEGAKKGLTTPYQVLLRNHYKEPASNQARLTQEVRELAARQPRLRPALEELDNLRPGEWFALSCMVKGKPATPEQPELTSSFA